MFSFGAPAAAAAPAASAAAPAATPAPAPSASSTALVSTAPAVSLRSASVESYATLLARVQEAWSGAAHADTLRNVIRQHVQEMATVQEQPPSASARASILSRNVELGGSKLNLSDDRTVQFLLDTSALLRINELDTLALVFSAANSLTATDPAFGRGSGAEVQEKLRSRAIELHFQRRFNLLLATLDLVLMEREGAASDEESEQSSHVTRVVSDAVAELIRAGIIGNVMAALEALHAPAPAAAPLVAASPLGGAAPAAPSPLPDVSAHRALEQSYLLRLLFALFKPSGSAAGIAGAESAAAAGEAGPIIALIEHLQKRSAAVTAAAAAAVAAAEQHAKQQQQQQQALAYGGAAPLFGAAPSAASQPAPEASGPESAANFELYVLLCTLMEALETKYRSVSQAAQAGARASAGLGSSGAGGAGSSSSVASAAAAAAAAAVANADADLYHFCASVSRKVSSGASWSNDVFRCGTLLLWSLFLKRVRLLHPGGQAVAETDEEVQQMVLEALGGAEGAGFFIHLHQTVATNPNFAPIRRAASARVGSGVVEEEESETEAANVAAGASAASSGGPQSAAASSALPSSAALVEDLSLSLGSFFHLLLLLHGQEIDLLRREDKKSSRAYEKQAARHAQLVAQQAQQQQVQFLQQQQQQQAQQQGQMGGAYGQLGSLGSLGSSAPAPSIVVGELPPPPLLNFASFLSALTLLVRSTPPLSELLWSSPEFESFLAAELHDSKSSSHHGHTRLGINPTGMSGATPGSLLSGSHGGNGGSSSGGHHSSSSSSSIFTSDSPFVLGYLSVLSALCSDSAGAARVYAFVRRCSRLNWEMVCVHYIQQGLIAHYTPQNVNQQQQGRNEFEEQARRGGGGAYGYGGQNAYRAPAPAPVAPPLLSARQLRLLSSLLRLLSSVVRPSPSLQRFFALHADYRLLESSFALLALRLPVSAKARVLELIASLATLNADISGQVWERLERSQVLPTRHYAAALAASAQATPGATGFSARTRAAPASLVAAGAPLEGLLFDLEEVENQAQLYPLTSAFLHLLVTLGESAPLPDALGQGVRGVGAAPGMLSSSQQSQQSSLSSTTAPGFFGLSPYVSFVSTHVFLNLPHRGYARPSESVQMAELCLALFARVADDFVQEVQARSGAHAPDGGDSTSAAFRARHQPLAFTVPQQAQGERAASLSSLVGHPGYTLVRSLLQGGELLVQVLAQLHAAYSLLEGGSGSGGADLAAQAEAGAMHPAVEGVLLQATRLLWLLLEHEDSLLDVLQRLEDGAARSGLGLVSRLSPLSALLLEHQAAVLSLARCVGFAQSAQLTPVQLLLRERAAKERARRTTAAAGISPERQEQAQASFLSDGDDSDDPAAVVSALSSSAALPSVDDGRSGDVAFYASSCLLLLSQRDEVRLVHILEAAGATSAVIGAAARQCLSAQLPQDAPLPGDDVPSDPDLACNRARLVLLDLLLSSLSAPSPAAPHLSLGLLLLGFDVATPAAVRATDLARSSRRALLDALLIELAPQQGFARRFPAMAQGVYRLLYTLLASPLTSGPIMRLLQSPPAGTQFPQGSSGGGMAAYLLSLLRGLPLVSDLRGLLQEWQDEEAQMQTQSQPLSSSFAQDVSVAPNSAAASSSSIALVRSASLGAQVHHSLFQLRWLLRAVSLHFFVLVGTQARARSGAGDAAASAEAWMWDEEVQAYLRELGFMNADEEDDDEAAQELDADQTSESNGRSDWFNAGAAQSASNFLAGMGSSGASAAARGTSATRPMLLLTLLSHVDTFLSRVLPPSFQLTPPPVDTASVLAASGGGSQANGSGDARQGINFEFASARYYDASQCALQFSLRDVYAGCASAGLSPSLRLEVTRRCLEWNAVAAVLGGAKAFMDSWRQCVEVVLAAAAEGMMRADAQAYERTLMRMLHAVLAQMTSANAEQTQEGGVSVWTALGEELSGLALTLISALRDVQRYTAALLVGGASSGPLGTSGGRAHSAQWHSVLSLLVSALLSARHAPTRSNLYAVFLHYVLLARAARQSSERALALAACLQSTRGREHGEAAAAHQAWSAIQAEQTRAEAANLATLSSHNLPLLKLVAADALEGSSRLRALSFRFLGVLLLGAGGGSTLTNGSTQVSRREQQGPSRFFSAGGRGSSRHGDEDASGSLPSSFTSSLLALFGRHNLLLLFLNHLRANSDALSAAVHARGLQGYELLLQAEACLGFLLQLALEPQGAAQLQEHQAVRVLASLSFLHSRPAPAYGDEHNDDGAAGAPSPLDKFLSVHTLAVQIVSTMLRALPSHATLRAHAQLFVSSQAQKDALAALLHESRAQVNAQSIEAQSAAIALLHQGIKAEQASSADETDADQRKMQKLSTGVRLSTQPRQGSSAEPLWEHQAPENDGAQQQQPFGALIQRHQGALFALLSRYFRPAGDSRLRAYLGSRLRERQMRADSGEAGAPDETQFDASAPAETLLEQGDDAVQRIVRQLLGLLVLRSSDPSLSTPLFGPQLDGGSSGRDMPVDTAGLHGEHARPQLSSLVSMLEEIQARSVDARQQQATLMANLAQLDDDLSSGQQSQSQNGWQTRADQYASSSGFASASTLAALELEYFPPSAAASTLFHELPAPARRSHLQAAIARALQANALLQESLTWSAEHMLMLLYQHVRVYLPSSTLSSRGATSSAQSTAQFRAAAESALVPLLQEAQRVLLPPAASDRAARGHANGQALLPAGSSADSRLALYGGGGALVPAAPVSFLQAAGGDASAGAFSNALLQRMLKHISG